VKKSTKFKEEKLVEEWERGEKLRKIPPFTFPSPECIVKPCEY